MEAQEQLKHGKKRHTELSETLKKDTKSISEAEMTLKGATAEDEGL